MRAGKIDRQIVIEQSTPTRNSVGENVDVWSTFDTVYAEIRPAGGRERDFGGGHRAEADLVFKIRWQAGVTRVMRIVYDGDNYDITRIHPLGRREALEIYGVAEVS